MSFRDKTSKCGKIKAGNVIRLFDGAFADAVVLGFNAEGDMKVPRPYVYASCVDTTGPVPLTGVETVTIYKSQIPAYVPKQIESDGHRIA